jgi:hypothetical protein
MASVADDTTPGKENTSTEAGLGSDSRRTRRRPSVSARQVAHGAKVGSDAVRNRIATIVRIAGLLGGILVALAALLIALQDNVRETNPIVEWLTGVGNALAGPFGEVRDGTFVGGVFNLKGTAKEVLTNWGVVAVLYLVAGRVAERIIRP